MGKRGGGGTQHTKFGIFFLPVGIAAPEMHLLPCPLNMRIGIDISSATPRRTGIGNYAHELARRLLRARGRQFAVLFNSLRQPAPGMPELALPDVTLRRLRIPGPALLRSWQWFDFPAIERLIGPVDVFLSPSTYVPPQRAGARVATVHDLSFMDPLNEPRSIGGRYLRWVCAHRLHQMHAVITDAESTVREIGEYLSRPGAPAFRGTIHAIPLGVDERFLAKPAPEAVEAMRRRHGLPEKYILYVGSREPRKNTPLLIRAFDILTRTRPGTPPLVMAGLGGRGTRDDEGAAGQLRRAGQLIMPGYVDAADMPALYRGAELLVLPSRMEGFGFPVLEAMACEAPVLCSNTARVLEYLGRSAAAVCDPEDNAGTLALHMAAVLDDAGMRQRMRAEGRTAAARFTWELCARRTLEVCEDAARRARDEKKA